MDRVRFHRQLVLAEIGEAGQIRIAGATARVPAVGLAGDIGARYAERAGFGVVTRDLPEWEVPSWIQDPTARAMVEGSVAAVAALRAVAAR